ncbi:MAG: hypothetical protein JRF61_13180 [Deltaproteobacteria bacterium]|nr:hypothetical protein [Deltaproteobacteria bacterium]
MVTDDQARAAAREILAQPEYAAEGQRLEAWFVLLERLLELTPEWLLDSVVWLFDALGAALQAIGRGLALFGLLGGPSEIVGWIAVGLLVSLVIVIVGRWQSAHEGRRRRRVETYERAQTHAGAARDARRLADEGRFLEAAHRLQLGALSLLVEFDWLELARSDPNPTLRRHIARSALPERERHQLVQLVDRLESLWFDARREDRELYEAWRSLDERLVSLVAGGRG